MSTDQRRNDLAKIHLAKKQLGLDDDQYRDLLWVVARVRSAADLDEFGRKKVIKHLSDCGATFTRKKRTRPAAGRVDLIAKIRAFLAEARRPGSYADGMARHMYGVDRYEWCNEKQLNGLIAALWRDAKRHGRPER